MATKMATRTVALAPIKAEVESYVAWVKAQGWEVRAVVWPKAAGVDVSVTFAYSVGK